MLHNRTQLVVFGAYGSFNFGDDLLMLIIKKILSSNPLIDTTFACSNQKYIKKLDPDLKIDDSFSSKNYDLIVYGGGTQVFQFEHSIGNHKASVFFKMLDVVNNPRRISGVLKRFFSVSNSINTPCFGIGLGFGPFSTEKEAYRLIREKLGGNCDLLIVRDELSYAYAVKSNYKPILGSDLCFDKSIFTYLPPIKDRVNPKSIGILLRDWEDDDRINKDFVNKIQELFTNLSISVTFISFSKKHDKKWREVILETTCQYLFWEPEKNDIFSFLSKFNNIDILISSRYHGLIFATLLEIPFISILIEPKIDNYSLNTFFQSYNLSYPLKINELHDKYLCLAHNYCEAINSIKLLKEVNISKAKVYTQEISRLINE